MDEVEQLFKELEEESLDIDPIFDFISDKLKDRRNIHACTKEFKKRCYEVIVPFYLNKDRYVIDQIFQDFEDKNSRDPYLEKKYEELLQSLNKKYQKDKDSFLDREELADSDILEVEELERKADCARKLEALDFWRIERDIRRKVPDVSNSEPGLNDDQRLVSPPENIENTWKHLLYFKGDCLQGWFLSHPLPDKKNRGSIAGSKLVELVLDLQDYLRDHADSLNANGYDHVRQINDMLLRSI